jgi:hypothetical protein
VADDTHLGTDHAQRDPLAGQLEADTNPATDGRGLGERTILDEMPPSAGYTVNALVRALAAADQDRGSRCVRRGDHDLPADI